MKKLILGRMNNCGILYYWELPEEMVTVPGKYAVVENMNDYDLVKIVATMETTDELSKLISRKPLKKVIRVLDMEDVEVSNNE